MNSFSIVSGGVNGLWCVLSAIEPSLEISEIIPIYTR